MGLHGRQFHYIPQACSERAQCVMSNCFPPGHSALSPVQKRPPLHIAAHSTTGHPPPALNTGPLRIICALVGIFYSRCLVNCRYPSSSASKALLALPAATRLDTSAFRHSAATRQPNTHLRESKWNDTVKANWSLDRSSAFCSILCDQDGPSNKHPAASVKQYSDAPSPRPNDIHEDSTSSNSAVSSVYFGSRKRAEWVVFPTAAISVAAARLK